MCANNFISLVLLHTQYYTVYVCFVLTMFHLFTLLVLKSHLMMCCVVHQSGEGGVHVAARYDEAHALCLLVVAGAEVNMLSATSITPLRVACASGSAMAAEVLVRLGADLYNGVGT